MITEARDPKLLNNRNSKIFTNSSTKIGIRLVFLNMINKTQEAAMIKRNHRHLKFIHIVDNNPMVSRT